MGIFNIISDKNLKHPTPESCTVVSRCTQTDVCDLPAKKTVPHMGCNTTPKFVRDKTTQHAPTLISKGISPHCVFIDKPTTNNWEQESSPPVTPDLDIPSYFTENFQQKRDYQDTEQLGTRVIPTSQGPMEESVSEDPLPTHFSRSSTMGSHPKK